MQSKLLRRLMPVVLSAVLAVLLATWDAAAQEPVLVAAASDLKFALEEAAQEFHRSSGEELRITYGSSGNFATQIENGAPFQFFLSADEGYVQRLAERGLTRGAGALYGIGRIVLFAATDSPVRADVEFRDLRAALGDGRLRRFAIANPEHAPYGRAAREALQSQGLWEAIAPRLVLGENVAQAAQFATTGSTQGAILPLSMVLSPKLSGAGAYALIPAQWHRPLRQRMVLLKHAGAGAEAFYRYLQSRGGRELLGRYGFTVPPEH